MYVVNRITTSVVTNEKWEKGACLHESARQDETFEFFVFTNRIKVSQNRIKVNYKRIFILYEVKNRRWENDSSAVWPNIKML